MTLDYYSLEVALLVLRDVLSTRLRLPVSFERCAEGNHSGTA
jgi:hypothetical protein